MNEDRAELKLLFLLQRTYPVPLPSSTNKYEKVGEYSYLGPFMLFSKLRELHENSLGPNGGDLSPWTGKSSQRITGLLHEIKSDSWINRILQFDVMSLYTENKELFWNLVFRFIKEKRDYLFLFPYERDMQHQSEDEALSGNSEDNLFRLIEWDNNEDQVNVRSTFNRNFTRSAGTFIKPKLKFGMHEPQNNNFLRATEYCQNKSKIKFAFQMH